MRVTLSTDATSFTWSFNSTRICVRLKPWPNGVASRRKLKAWVYLWLRLARPCVYLRWLAMSCAHLRSLLSRSNLHASGCKFFTVWPPNPSHASWVTSINLLANEIQEMSALNCYFCDLRVLVRKFGRSFGHPTQVSTQVQLAYTCNYLPVRLARALDLLVDIAPISFMQLQVIA